MKTALLMINYNDAETSKVLLNNIRNYQCLDLIVVLDNASTDQSYEILKEYENEKIHVIKSEGNKGYAYAINYGCHYLIKLFQECNIIVSNPDIIIYKEEDLVKLIHSKTDAMAIVAPIIKEGDGISRGWKIPSPFQDAVLNIIYLHRLLKSKFLYYADSYYEKESLVEVEVVLGCFFILDSRAIKKAGFYDEQTFLYYEENIMAKKLKDLHAKTIINTEVEVFHNHSVSIDKSINRLKKVKLLKESQYYFQKRYNKANFFERIALLASAKFSYIIFWLLYRIC